MNGILFWFWIITNSKKGGEEELVYAQMLLSALSPTQKYTKCGISNYSKCLL